MTVTVRNVLAVLLLLSPALSHGQGSNVFVVVPDGRTETASIAPNTSSVYLFSTMGGHSYSVEQSRGLNSPILNMWVGPQCPNNSNGSIVDTSAMDPAVNINTGSGPQRQREAFACPGPFFPGMQPGTASVMIYNSTPNVYTFSLTVIDTTLNSPKFKATTSADTFWTFTNSSSAAVNITVSFVDAYGNYQPLPGLPNPQPMNIAPGATLSIDTTQIPQQFRTNPPAGVSGSVRVTEDGPPGAILATAAIVTNANGPTPTSETVKFAPR